MAWGLLTPGVGHREDERIRVIALRDETEMSYDHDRNFRSINHVSRFIKEQRRPRLALV